MNIAIGSLSVAGPKGSALRWLGTLAAGVRARLGIESPWRRVRSALSRGLKAIQYGQMISVLNRMPDTCLNEAGLRRSDIPEHARRAVYGED